jgi:hypothetical protein
MTEILDAETIAILEHRLARKLKLLPELRYPNDEESKKLVELAKFDPTRADEFAGHIRSIILDAHLNFSRRGVSAKEVREKLCGIASQAQKLSRNLRSIDVGSGGSEERAGRELELEFRKLKLPELIDLFQTLGEAAQAAAAKPQQRAKEKFALEILVHSLYMAAIQRGGYWAIYKATNQTYGGPLLEALEILKKYLPKEMFPGGQIKGHSILYFYEKAYERAHQKDEADEAGEHKAT